MCACCAVIGCTPTAFPWGWDEEDEYCMAMKLTLLNQITHLQSRGTTDFHVSMDCGAGLYAAEIINSLLGEDNRLRLTGFIPCEEQPTKWTSELRNRYFNTLAGCTELINAALQKTVGCEFEAHLRTIAEAETVIAVYDPDNPACEREAATVSVAKMMEKQIIVINPNLIR